MQFSIGPVLVETLNAIFDWNSQAKIPQDLTKIASITLEGLWMVSDRIVDFDFLSNFTGPDLQLFSVFELSRSMLVIVQKRFLIKPRFLRTSPRLPVLLWKDYGWFRIELSISIFCQISQVRTCKYFQFLN